jgi:hypothetical protein
LETADYALLVSLFSALVAIAAFVWNIWSKWIYPKARLRLSFGVIVAHFGNGPQEDQPHYLRLSMTNFGPTELTVTQMGIRIAPARFWKKSQHAIVNPITSLYTPDLAGGPFAGGLPKKMAVGETFDLFFPHDAESFARMKLTRVGVFDTFGRFHGARRSDIRRAKQELDEAFPATL